MEGNCSVQFPSPKICIYVFYICDVVAFISKTQAYADKM